MARFILSDDLTGASGVASMVGPGAVTVNLDDYDRNLSDGFSCVAINLDVREKSGREAVRAAAKALRLIGDYWVTARIDSALRGPIPEMLGQIAPRGKILVTDTIPEYGRATSNGMTMMSGQRRSLDAIIDPVRRKMSGGRVTVEDSRTWTDLRALAKRCLREDRLPVDPGPLISLVLKEKLGRPGRPIAEPTLAHNRSQRVAFVIGTRDPATLKQLRWMQRRGFNPHRPSVLDPANVRVFSFSLDDDSKLIDPAFLESLRDYDTVVLSGGATATFLLGKSGFECIVNGDQVQPLVSTGRVRGGTLDGKSVVLKGGGIGDEKAYMTILGWLKKN